MTHFAMIYDMKNFHILAQYVIYNMYMPLATVDYQACSSTLIADEGVA